MKARTAADQHAFGAGKIHLLLDGYLDVGFLAFAFVMISIRKLAALFHPNIHKPFCE